MATNKNPDVPWARKYPRARPSAVRMRCASPSTTSPSSSSANIRPHSSNFTRASGPFAMPKTQHNISWPTTWAVPRAPSRGIPPFPVPTGQFVSQISKSPPRSIADAQFCTVAHNPANENPPNGGAKPKNGGIAMAQIGVAASRRERLPAGHPQRSDCTYQFVCHISVSRRKTVAGAQSRTIAHNSTRKSVEKAPRRPTAAMGSPRPKSYKIRCTRA